MSENTVYVSTPHPPPLLTLPGLLLSALPLSHSAPATLASEVVLQQAGPHPAPGPLPLPPLGVLSLSTQGLPHVLSVLATSQMASLPSVFKPILSFSPIPPPGPYHHLEYCMFYS